MGGGGSFGPAEAFLVCWLSALLAVAFSSGWLPPFCSAGFDELSTGFSGECLLALDSRLDSLASDVFTTGSTAVPFSLSAPDGLLNWKKYQCLKHLAAVQKSQKNKPKLVFEVESLALFVFHSILSCRIFGFSTSFLRETVRIESCLPSRNQLLINHL